MPRLKRARWYVHHQQLIKFRRLFVSSVISIKKKVDYCGKRLSLGSMRKLWKLAGQEAPGTDQCSGSAISIYLLGLLLSSSCEYARPARKRLDSLANMTQGGGLKGAFISTNIVTFELSPSPSEDGSDDPAAILECKQPDRGGASRIGVGMDNFAVSSSSPERKMTSHVFLDQMSEEKKMDRNMKM
ncbi:hypothetical protein SELMODRAFT_419329 [Selaginella moellendorffii]|uniref:Uncharacterized protein n=1 Tax=Selaginella moellendorffii TaxID=88036 RepID=D8S8K4_SELML|nr:hypothetical protein SELMODRAFT_419329 [Selaginella moellendorffii]